MIRAGVKTFGDAVDGIQQDNSISLKRKVCDDHQYLALEDNIKRFRITHTPGEIRLGKDLKELRDLTEVAVKLTDDPACVSVCFAVSTLNNVSLPSEFLVKVPRYYPHHSPSVFCTQAEFKSPIIDPESHEIAHANLQSGWSAIGTLKTVLFILDDIRMQFARNEFKLEHAVISGSPACARILHRYKESSAGLAPYVIDADADFDSEMMEN